MREGDQGGVKIHRELYPPPKKKNNNKKKHSLTELDNHYGVVTYLESDILEYEVKLALGSTK